MRRAPALRTPDRFPELYEGKRLLDCWLLVVSSQGFYDEPKTFARLKLVVVVRYGVHAEFLAFKTHSRASTAPLYSPPRSP